MLSLDLLVFINIYFQLLFLIWNHWQYFLFHEKGGKVCSALLSLAEKLICQILESKLARSLVYHGLIRALLSLALNIMSVQLTLAVATDQLTQGKSGTYIFIFTLCLFIEHYHYCRCQEFIQFSFFLFCVVLFFCFDFCFYFVCVCFFVVLFCFLGLLCFFCFAFLFVCFLFFFFLNFWFEFFFPKTFFFSRYSSYRL